jgi:predicted DCC family thiol-disulfide oxidoreductase YuxK
MQALGRLVVLYDGDCGFCTWTARLLRRWDRSGRMATVPLQQAARHDALGALVAGRDLTAAIHVVEPGGRIKDRGAAMIAILDALPGGWLLRPWTRLPGARRVLDPVYDALAVRRDRLGALVERLGGDARCELPARPRPEPAAPAEDGPVS